MRAASRRLPSEARIPKGIRMAVTRLSRLPMSDSESPHFQLTCNIALEDPFPRLAAQEEVGFVPPFLDDELESRGGTQAAVVRIAR